MARPRAFEASSRFLGAERTYTRQRLYRRDDSDLRAEAHDEPLDRVRRGYTVPLRDLDEDPYEEAHHVGVFEREDAIEQFRSDARSERFRALVDESRHHGIDADGAARESVTMPKGAARSTAVRSLQEMRDARKRQRRARAEIVRVMERQTQQRTLFTVNYAGCVPAEYVDEFLSTVEARPVCDALVPMLNKLEFAAADGDDSMQTHIEEGQLVRVLYETGCVLERSDTLEVRGRLADHAASFDDPIDRAWYTDAMCSGAHAHYDADADVTLIRQLCFHIPTSAADADGAQLREVADAAGYRVKVVTHLVERSPDAKLDALNVLCFRSFHFTRYY